MIHVAIVDDEQPAVDLLKTLLSHRDEISVDLMTTNPLDVLHGDLSVIDILFVDIEMPEMNGLELAQQVTDRYPALHVVFVTAYNEYAVDAFNLHALDYLMKPVQPKRLEETLALIEERAESDHMNTAELCSVKTFGVFSVHIGDTLITFRTRKAEELLAYLLSAQGNFVSRSVLLDMLWPDFEGDKALMNFNTTLYYLKKSFSSLLHRKVVIQQRGSYKVDIDCFSCDFIHLKEASRNTSVMEDADLDFSLSIIAEYHERYLAASDYPWVYNDQLRYESMYSNLVGKAVEILEKRNNITRALELAETALAIVPGDDNINYLTMRLLLRVGNGVKAREYFDLYRKRLEQEHSLKPSQRYKELFS